MISIIQQDITSLSVDAIVNAANTSLLGGGGVDGAIHRAAGPELLEYNRQLNGCQTGEAKLAPGFNLSAKWIIHTVGPVWQGGATNEAELLSNCYRNALLLAMEQECQSIAFPSISTGVNGYPIKEAAFIALETMQQFSESFEEIVACCFSSDDQSLYEAVYRQLIN